MSNDAFHLTLQLSKWYRVMLPPAVPVLLQYGHLTFGLFLLCSLISRFLSGD